MRPHFIGICFAFALLTACADTASLNRANEISQEGKALFLWTNEMIHYDALPASVPKGMTVEAFEKKQFPLLTNKCLAPRQPNFDFMIHQMADAAAAGEKMRVFDYGARQAKNIEDKFASCAQSLGLKAETLIVLQDGRMINIAELLNRAGALLAEKQRALETYAQSVEEQNQLWSNVGYALAAAAVAYNQQPHSYPVSPSQIWISPYYKMDGTVVSDHWRTTPNETCLDNIRGCR